MGLALALMPGYGGSYTTESIADASGGGTNGVDTIDASKCAQFAVEVVAVTGSPTIQLQQTLDGTNWASLGSAITASVGTISRFGASSGPYGLLRVLITGSSVAATLKFVGFANQWSS